MSVRIRAAARSEAAKKTLNPPREREMERMSWVILGEMNRENEWNQNENRHRSHLKKNGSNEKKKKKWLSGLGASGGGLAFIDTGFVVRTRAPTSDPCNLCCSWMGETLGAWCVHGCIYYKLAF